MAIRAIQAATLNHIQFAPITELPDAIHQYQMGKAPFRLAQLSWQKKTKYAQKIQHTDRINVQLERTEVNDIDLYIVDCNDDIVENISSLAQKATIAGNLYDGEQLHTHHYSFRFEDYNLDDGTYFLRAEAKYYDGIDVIDSLVIYSEPLLLKDSHANTVYMQYQYYVNKEDVIFNHPDINSFRFGLRFEGFIGNYQPDSADVYFKEQDYDQRVISSTPWRKFTLNVGGMKALPPYIIEKVNAALSCGQTQGLLLINGVQYVKDDGAKLEVEPLNNDVYPMFRATVDIREYSPVQAITYSKNSAFLIVEGMTYPYNIQRVNFATPTRTAVILSDATKYTVIEDSAGLDAFVTYMNNVRIPDIGGLTGVVERRGDDLWYVNGEGETYTSGLRIQNQYLMTFTVNAAAAPKDMYLSLGEGYATIYWNNDRRSLHEPVNNTNIVYGTEYLVDGEYEVELWHNGIVRSISHDAGRIVNGVLVYDARITQITGQAPWRLRSFAIANEDFTALTDGLDLHFLSAAGLPNRELTILTIAKSGLQGLDGTVFADNPYQPTAQWWAALTIVNFNGNNFVSSEVDEFVNDFYVNTPHLNAGTLGLAMVPPTAATGTAAARLVLLDNAGWNIQQ